MEEISVFGSEDDADEPPAADSEDDHIYIEDIHEEVCWTSSDDKFWNNQILIILHPVNHVMFFICFFDSENQSPCKCIKEWNCFLKTS